MLTKISAAFVVFSASPLSQTGPGHRLAGVARWSIARAIAVCQLR